MEEKNGQNGDMEDRKSMIWRKVRNGDMEERKGRIRRKGKIA
jgi:hypothetical protein